MQKNSYNLFRYPVVVWFLVWLLFFLLHLQIAFEWAIFKATLITLLQWINFQITKKWLIKKYLSHKRIFFVMSLCISFVLASSGTAFELFLADRFFSYNTLRPPFLILMFMQFLLFFVAGWICVSIHLINYRSKRKKRWICSGMRKPKPS